MHRCNYFFTEFKTTTEAEQKFGKYKNISLTPEEYNRLIKLYGKEQTDNSIEVASEYGHCNNNRHYGYVRIYKWIRDDVEQAKQNQTQQNQEKPKTQKQKGKGYRAHHDDDFDVDKYKIFVNDFTYI